MKNLITKLTLVLPLLFLFSISSHAQYGWIQQTSPTSDPLGGVYFIDENTGFAVDAWYGKILKTTNGGTIWSIHFSFFSGLSKLCFLNHDSGTIVGASGNILFTTDGGNNWIIKSSGTNANLNRIRFVKNNMGYTSTGFIVGGNGVVLKTTNSGYNWFSQNSSTNHYLYSVYFTDMNTGYIVGQVGYQSGQSTVLKTTNGGTTWLNISPGIFNSLIDVCFINSNTGVVVGGNGYWNNGIILKTTDGGNSWVTVLTNSSAIHGICKLNNNVLTAVGNNGLILRSTDTGSTWSIQNTPTSFLLMDVNFINVNTGWAVGHGGVILKTTTGGASIPSPPVLTSPPHNSVNISVTPTLTWNTSQGAETYHVQISTVANFYVITDSATVSSPQYQVPTGKLMNGYTYFWRVNASNPAGTSAWSSTWSFSTGIYPPAPVLISPPNGFIGTPTTPTLVWDSLQNIISYRIEISRIPNFLNIVDSSTVFINQYIVPPEILFDNITYFWRVNASNSFGSGPWSEVWSFTPQPSGINPIAGEIPTSFNLFQNYPNPFNPSTNIKFDIPKSSYVKITVYDNLGKEVAKLVDKKLSAGSYEVNWIAKNYASGIYYYRIGAEEFTNVKKMLLIK